MFLLLYAVILKKNEFQILVRKIRQENHKNQNTTTPKYHNTIKPF